jgi:hypothetical protein
MTVLFANYIKIGGQVRNIMGFKAYHGNILKTLGGLVIIFKGLMQKQT